MRIGELAKRSGLSASRIRFYEASGLITSVARTANGYRDYTAQALWTLQLIASAQGAGFTLDEIRQLLPTSAEGWHHDELLAGLKRKVAEIEVLQQQLEQNRAQLLVAIDSIENRPEDRACSDNARLLMERLMQQQPT